MKRTLIISMLFLLTSCYNIEFDSLEYDRYVFLKQKIDNSVPACSTPQMSSIVDGIKEDVDHQFLYSSNRADRPHIAESSKQLKDIVDRLQVQYQRGTPSVEYCKNKLQNVSDGTSKIIEQLGRF